MSSLPAEIGTAVALFAGTNIDDVVVLALLNASSRATGRPPGWAIWAGQCAGFGILLGVSAAAGRGLALIPERWLWPLALIPLGMGITSLVKAIRALRHGEEAATPSVRGPFGAAAITIADGGDNIATYTPFFATTGTAQAAVTLMVFAVCVAAWCLAGALLARHSRVTGIIGRYGQWILPVTFILIGLYILNQTAAPFRG